MCGPRPDCSARLARLMFARFTYIGFVHFHRPEQWRLAALLGPCLAQAMQHELCGLLPDFQVSVQFHAGYALEAGQAKVNSNGPAKRYLGIGHRRTCLYTEVLVAIAAMVGHRLAALYLRCASAAAMAAASLFGPVNGFEPLNGRFLGREYPHQFNERDTRPECLVGCFTYAPSFSAWIKCASLIMAGLPFFARYLIAFSILVP